MKRFTLTLLVKEPSIIERIESDDMIELLCQFQLVVGTIVKRTIEHDELMKHIKENDDEIPF